MNQDPFSIKLDTSQFEKDTRKLKEKLKNMKPLTASIASLMRTATIDEFETEGHGEWKPTKIRSTHSSFKKNKFTKKGVQTKAFQRFAKGKKILTLSGQLRKSVQSESDKTTALVGSNKVYARIHQEGGDAGRNHASKIPARPFLNIRPKLEQDVNDTVRNYFRE